MKKTILFSLLIFLLLSCSEKDINGLALARPALPETKVFDINRDAVDDFTIAYSNGVWDGFEASGSFVDGSIKPLGENSILQEYEENVSTTYLFAQKGDSIHRQAEDSRSWAYRSRLVSLYQGGDGVWPKEWRIESPKASAPYYIGMQIQEGDTFLIGWLKLEIDVDNGEIAIQDSAFTKEDSIVIDR